MQFLKHTPRVTDGSVGRVMGPGTGHGDRHLTQDWVNVPVPMTRVTPVTRDNPSPLPDIDSGKTIFHDT